MRMLVQTLFNNMLLIILVAQVIQPADVDFIADVATF